KAGFDAFDFSMFAMCKYDWGKDIVLPSAHPLYSGDYLAFARRLKQVASDNGIVCNQSHAPFPVCNKDIRSYLKRSIECTAEAGGEICIIHPDNNKGPKENAEMYFELLPFAKECGVKIATENMFNWDREADKAIFAACATPESFLAHLDAVNDDYLVACLDIGHCEIMGDGVSAVQMVKALGSRIKALHIHDNDLHYDRHWIPFYSHIDFDPIVKALKEIGYQGYFTLEATVPGMEHTENGVADALSQLSSAVRRLADKFESF
ncbi:MAG: sugar phosphate isomerase/epimerase, partial [Clostridia bacterium]|nr:sugar phosphate isomerase/epimerase [Clostridia bacterium]